MQGLRRDGGTAPFSYQSPLVCCRLWAVRAPRPETQRAREIIKRLKSIWYIRIMRYLCNNNNNTDFQLNSRFNGMHISTAISVLSSLEAACWALYTRSYEVAELLLVVVICKEHLELVRFPCRLSSQNNLLWTPAPQPLLGFDRLWMATVSREQQVLLNHHLIKNL